jgi:hypothetical protein
LQCREVERVQPAKKPAIGTARGIEPIQQRACRTVDLVPDVAADDAKYRGFRPRRFRVIRCIGAAGGGTAAIAKRCCRGFDFILPEKRASARRDARIGHGQRQPLLPKTRAFTPVDTSGQGEPFDLF